MNHSTQAGSSSPTKEDDLEPPTRCLHHLSQACVAQYSLGHPHSAGGEGIARRKIDVEVFWLSEDLLPHPDCAKDPNQCREPCPHDLEQ